MLTKRKIVPHLYHEAEQLRVSVVFLMRGFFDEVDVPGGNDDANVFRAIRNRLAG